MGFHWNHTSATTSCSNTTTASCIGRRKRLRSSSNKRTEQLIFCYCPTENQLVVVTVVLLLFVVVSEVVLLVKVGIGNEHEPFWNTAIVPPVVVAAADPIATTRQQSEDGNSYNHDGQEENDNDASIPSTSTNTVNDDNNYQTIADFVVTIPPKETDETSSNNNVLLTLAFGSCHKTKYRDMNIWNTIAKKSKPDGFLWLGDTIYPPSKKIATLQQLYNEYSIMINDPTVGYTEFIKYMQQKESHIRVTEHFSSSSSSIDNNSNMNHHKVAIFGIWDDHDYGGNDMGNEMKQKYERSQLFYNFLVGQLSTTPSTSSSSSPFGGPDDYHQQGQKQRDGIYYTVDFRTTASSLSKTTTVRVIFLDTRWNRSTHCIPAATGYVPIIGAGIACLTRWISAGLLSNYCQNKQQQNKNMNGLLGMKQWKWLEDVIKDTYSSNTSSNKVDVLLIASSIQVFTTNPAMESWGHYPLERKRLLQLLVPLNKQQQQQQPITTLILSGDVHHGEMIDPFNALFGNTKKEVELLEQHRHKLYEITSSALTHHCGHGLYGILCKPLLQTFYKHRYKDSNQYYIGRNYGTISIHVTTNTDETMSHRYVSVNLHAVENGTIVLSIPPIPIDQQQQHQQEEKSFGNDNNHNANQRSLTEQDLDSVYSVMDGHLLPYVVPYGIPILLLSIVLAFGIVLIGIRIMKYFIALTTSNDAITIKQKHVTITTTESTESTKPKMH